MDCMCTLLCSRCSWHYRQSLNGLSLRQPCSRFFPLIPSRAQPHFYHAWSSQTRLFRTYTQLKIQTLLNSYGVRLNLASLRISTRHCAFDQSGCASTSLTFGPEASVLLSAIDLWRITRYAICLPPVCWFLRLLVSFQHFLLASSRRLRAQNGVSDLELAAGRRKERNRGCIA